MKVLLLGDTHVGARKDSIAFQEYFTKFYTDILIPYIVKHKIKKIIQLGDFFDNRKSTHTRSLNWIKETLIKPLAELNVDMYVICGNHDTVYKNSIQLNAINEHLGHYPHVHPISKCTKLKLGRITIDLIPWIAPENQKEVAEFVSKTKSKICCGHFEFSGYCMQKGMVSNHGISIKEYEKYEQVFSGHFHTSSTDGHIFYAGTPYELTWSDCNDPKGFNVLDTLKSTTKRVINPYKMYHKIFYSDEHEKIDIAAFDYDMYKDS